MGVSGCGKTTISERLAEQLRTALEPWQAFDADHFHPEANVAKMRAGIALNDDDRWPWLEQLNELLRNRSANRQPTVLACSALKEIYREKIARDVDVGFIHLVGSFDLIESRMRSRAGHYMPSTLLKSQFETLEPPSNSVNISIELPPEQIVQTLVQTISPNSTPSAKK